MLCGFMSHLPRSSVRGHPSDTLQIRTIGTVSEYPSRLDVGVRPRVVSGDLLEQRKNDLSALSCVSRHDAQLVHRQLEVGWSRCHAFIVATAAE